MQGTTKVTCTTTLFIKFQRKSVVPTATELHEPVSRVILVKAPQRLISTPRSATRAETHVTPRQRVPAEILPLHQSSLKPSSLKFTTNGFRSDPTHKCQISRLVHKPDRPHPWQSGLTARGDSYYRRQWVYKSVLEPGTHLPYRQFEDNEIWGPFLCVVG